MPPKGKKPRISEPESLSRPRRSTRAKAANEATTKITHPAKVTAAKATSKLTKTTKKTTQKVTKTAKAKKNSVSTSRVAKAAKPSASLGTKAKSAKASTKASTLKPSKSNIIVLIETSSKTEATLAITPKTKVSSPKPQLNTAPTQRLDVYVFGSGESCELGLGPVKRNGKKPTNVTRPRLNDFLDAQTVGIVQLDVGGMHCIALTHDNKIITWGVNDNCALGRNTAWDAPMKDTDEDSDDDDDDDFGLNPMECTPTAIPATPFEKDVIFVQVAATDSASFALTADGRVYGWGTFRGADGIIGFTREDAEGTTPKLKQETPIIIKNLKNIKALAAGGNHIQALDNKGNVFSWGSGGQYQLGRPVAEKYRLYGLNPSQFGLPKNKIIKVACGAFHSFAIDNKDNVYAWGLNNYGQTGIAAGAGEDKAAIQKPTIIKSLSPYSIMDIQGGNHHSLACAEDGTLLVWGRCDENEAGILLENLPKESLVFDDRNRPRILTNPTVIPGISAVSVAAAIDNSLAITKDGEVYSWGFSSNYRTGLGTDDPVERATIIENTAVKGKKLIFAGCGGQFSVLAGVAGETSKTE